MYVYIYIHIHACIHTHSTVGSPSVNKDTRAHFTCVLWDEMNVGGSFPEMGGRFFCFACFRFLRMLRG